MKSRGKKKKGKLAQHFTCLAHKLTVQKLNAFMDKTHHVDVELSSARKQQLGLEEKERLRNREIVQVLLDCCRFLVRQGLAFRGSQDDSDGNFQKLTELLGRWVPFLEYWIHSKHSHPYRASYLTGRSQNEFISLVGSEVRDSIVKDIKSSGIYAVLADTTPDVSHVDQISLIIRYVDHEYNISV